MEPTSNEVVYEIINKETGVASLASQVAFGTGEVTVDTVDGMSVVFANDGMGNLSNENFLIRDSATKLAPNGVDTVEDIVITNGSEPVAETVVEEAVAEVTPEATPETPSEVAA